MIQTGTRIQVADNSGAKIVECIKVFPKSEKNNAAIGDLIIVAVKKAVPNKKIKKGQICHAVIIRTKKNICRTDGTIVRFSTNAVVLVNSMYAPIGTRIFGPIAQELRKEKFIKIISIASSYI